MIKIERDVSAASKAGLRSPSHEGHLLMEGEDHVIKLSSLWKRSKTWLPAPAVMATARFGHAVPARLASRVSRTWESVAAKWALVGLVPVTAATLAIASTASVSSPAPSAYRPAKAVARVHVEARITAHAKVRPVPRPLKAAVATLAQSFNPFFGEFADIHWRQAVAMSAMESYRQTTGDTTYDYTFDNPQLDHEPASFFENNLNDDNAWWGLALLQGYSITHNRYWLQDAKDIANYIGETWNTNPMACFDGGIPWNRRGPDFGYTGAIQNGLFLELTAWLHNAIVENGGTDSGRNSYLNWAKREWSYLQRTGDFHSNPIPLPNTGGFAGPPTLEPYWVPNGSPDLPNVSPTNDLCGSTRYRIFTYNQGVLIAGLVQLYKATNDNLKYLKYAEDIAKAVVMDPTPSELAGAIARIRAGQSPWIFTFPFSGVLIEPQDPPFSSTCCLGDGAAFKGIFVRDLRMLDDTIASKNTSEAANSGPQCTATYHRTPYYQCTTMYNDFFTRQACSIEAFDTTEATGYSINPGGDIRQQDQFLGNHWTGPNEPYDTTTQVSGLEAFVAAVNLPANGPAFPDCQPRQRSPGEHR
jgi:hypothetical protein